MSHKKWSERDRQKVVLYVWYENAICVCVAPLCKVQHHTFVTKVIGIRHHDERI